MQRILLFAVLMGLSVSVFAQTGKGTIYKAPLRGTTVVKDLPQTYNLQVYNLEAPSPDGDADKIRLMKAKEEVSKMFPRTGRRSAAKTTAAKAPVVTVAYDANENPGIPPDNDLAVSKGGKAVSVINSNVYLMDAQSGNTDKVTGLGLFSSSAGVGFNRYDPKVVYDSEKDRFICVMLRERDSTNYIVVGFSMSNDPVGTWAWYAFYGDYKQDDTWFDYPGVAITKDEFFLTGNKIKFGEPWETGFSETVIYQINKQDGYDSAANLTYKIWDGIKYNGQSIRNLFPVKPGWVPDSDEQYFVSNRNFDTQNDTIFLVKVPGKISAGGNITVDVLKAPTSYGVPPNGLQPDTSVVLNTNDGRILGAYAMYDEIQLVSTSVHPVNGNAAIYHAVISNYKTSPTVKHVDFFTVDTLDFGYPNVSYVGTPWGLNQSIISFNFTGANTFPGVAAIMYDGLSYSDMTVIKTGNSHITRIGGKNQRWGDYMGSQVDYNQLGAVWVEGIYGKTTGTNYGNYIARLNSPSLNVDDIKEATDVKLYPNPVQNTLFFEFNLVKAGNVEFSIYDMTGKLVDKAGNVNCKKGANMLHFDAAKLVPGNYILKAITEDGTSVMTEQFTRQ